MHRAASRLSLPCRTRSGAHPGVHPPLRVDCRFALPNAALALVIGRSTLNGLNVALVEIPRLDGFQRLHWSWQECILSTA